MFDVLQLMRPEEQEALLSEMATRLEPGGVVLVREADASAGWAFAAVRLGNRLKAIAFGTRHQAFHARTARGMARVFRATRLQDRGTPDGSRDAVRQRAVPPHRGAGRVCACVPIVTSCVSARPSGPKTPPNHSAHARPLRSIRRSPAVAQIGPAHRSTPVALGRLDGKAELVRPEKILHGVQRSRRDRPARTPEGRAATGAALAGPPRLLMRHARTAVGVRSNTSHSVSDPQGASAARDDAASRCADPIGAGEERTLEAQKRRSPCRA